jgi:hypothetical protein
MHRFNRWKVHYHRPDAHSLAIVEYINAEKPFSARECFYGQCLMGSFCCRSTVGDVFFITIETITRKHMKRLHPSHSPKVSIDVSR